jgi:hypothetical protein
MNIYCFKGNQNDSHCTSTIDLETIESVECTKGFTENNLIIVLKSKSENFSFKAEENYEKNEWTLKLKMVVTSIKNKSIDEKEEIEFEKNTKIQSEVF